MNLGEVSSYAPFGGFLHSRSGPFPGGRAPTWR